MDAAQVQDPTAKPQRLTTSRQTYEAKSSVERQRGSVGNSKSRREDIKGGGKAGKQCCENGYETDGKSKGCSTKASTGHKETREGFGEEIMRASARVSSLRP